MRKSTLLLLTLLLGFLPALAQQVVTGTVVTAPDNEAAIGASIIVKEHSKVGTTVGLDGSFKITVPAGSKTLRISYIGYLTQEVPIKDKMKITLEPSEKTLDKVVVTGLTKVDKRLFTGASAKLGGDKAKLDGVPDAARALEGDLDPQVCVLARQRHLARGRGLLREYAQFLVGGGADRPRSPSHRSIVRQ